MTQEERAQAERLYADLIRNGTVPPEPRRAPVRPALAFGKKKPDWSPDRRGSRAGQQSELSKTIIADAEVGTHAPILDATWFANLMVALCSASRRNGPRNVGLTY